MDSIMTALLTSVNSCLKLRNHSDGFDPAPAWETAQRADPVVEGLRLNTAWM